MRGTVAQLRSQGIPAGNIADELIAIAKGVTKLIFLIPALILLTSVSLFFRPEPSRKNLLFGVPITAEFRKSNAARRAIRWYRIAVLAGSCLAAAGWTWAHVENSRALALQAAVFVVRWLHGLLHPELGTEDYRRTCVPFPRSHPGS